MDGLRGVVVVYAVYNDLPCPNIKIINKDASQFCISQPFIYILHRAVADHIGL